MWTKYCRLSTGADSTGLTGILAALADALKRAQVPIFAISTWYVRAHSGRCICGPDSRGMREHPRWDGAALIMAGTPTTSWSADNSSRKQQRLSARMAGILPRIELVVQITAHSHVSTRHTPSAQHVYPVQSY